MVNVHSCYYLCNWCYTILVELPSVSLGLLSHHRCFMSKFDIAHRHASISKHGTSSLLLLAHQVLCYCSLAKPDSLQKATVWLHKDYRCGTIFVEKNVMAGISAHSSVSSFHLRLCTSIFGHY